MIVFENVLSEDKGWDIMAMRMGQVGYASKFVILDTKNFYIPHT